MHGSDAYRWEITYIGFDDTRRVEVGGGQFGSPDPTTGRTCRTYIEVGTALFDTACDEVTDQHYHDVLDARIEDRPEPAQPIRQVRACIRDADDTDRMSV